MARNIKMIPTCFLVYDYDKEEDYINSMSGKGWQLKKGGMFHHTYERNNQNYRYKLDYNNKVNFSSDEFSRYLCIFDEQGWEHINTTANGWHYFRKKYNPILSEEEYEIYTDDASLKEMLGKWIKIAHILQIVMLFLLLCYLPLFFTEKSPLALMDIIVVSVGILLLGLAVWHLKRKRVNARTKSVPASIAGYVLLLSLLMIVILTLFLSFYKPNVYTDSFVVNQDTPKHTDTVTLKSNGRYGMYIKSESESGYVIVRFTRIDNHMIFRTGGLDDEEGWFQLKAGKYHIEAIYYPENYNADFGSLYDDAERMDLTDNSMDTGNVKVSVKIKKSFY